MLNKINNNRSLFNKMMKILLLTNNLMHQSIKINIINNKHNNNNKYSNFNSNNRNISHNNNNN